MTLAVFSFSLCHPLLAFLACVVLEKIIKMTDLLNLGGSFFISLDQGIDPAESLLYWHAKRCHHREGDGAG